MIADTDDMTDRLLKRAEHALALLQWHLDDRGARSYAGRTKAAHAIVAQMGKDYRYNAAYAKQAARARRARRNPKNGAVHERM